jgi:hypothetical protein
MAHRGASAGRADARFWRQVTRASALSVRGGIAGADRIAREVGVAALLAFYFSVPGAMEPRASALQRNGSSQAPCRWGSPEDRSAMFSRRLRRPRSAGALLVTGLLLLGAGLASSCAGTRREDGDAALERGWERIERSASKAMRGSAAQVHALLAALQQLPAEEIVAFDAFLQVQLERSYRWDLWAVAYLVMGGCSDDAFLYFRAWLVAQGREVFEAALLDPSSAARDLRPGDLPVLESLLYVAEQAHRAATGSALPRASAPRRAREPEGAAWDEDDLALLYPELARRFGRS